MEAVLNVREATASTPGAVLSVTNRMAAAQNGDYPLGSLEGSVRLFSADDRERTRAIADGAVAYDKLWAEPIAEDLRQRLETLSGCDDRVLRALGPRLASMSEAFGAVNRAIAEGMESRQ